MLQPPCTLSARITLMLGGAQHLIFEIGQRLRGRDDDRIAGVHADRIDVLHVADDDAVVRLVAQDFVLDLFPAEQRRFEQRLMDQAGRQSRVERFAQLRFVVDDAAAGSAERVRRPNDQRIAFAFGKGDAGLDVGDDLALGHRLADLDHLALEALAVFGQLDRLDRRAEQFDAVSFEDAGFVELDGKVQPGLAAQRRAAGRRAARAR